MKYERDWFKEAQQNQDVERVAAFALNSAAHAGPAVLESARRLHHQGFTRPYDAGPEPDWTTIHSALTDYGFNDIMARRLASNAVANQKKAADSEVLRSELDVFAHWYTRDVAVVANRDWAFEMAKDAVLRGSGNEYLQGAWAGYQFGLKSQTEEEE